MLRFLVTAASSNSGKTAVTCGLLSLLKRKGYDPCAFKCGPDYIDPMFHRSVLGIDSDNLDVFLAGEDGVRSVFARGCQGHDAAVCEGVMGYYDGLTSAAGASTNGPNGDAGAAAGSDTGAGTTAGSDTDAGAAAGSDTDTAATTGTGLFPRASAWHVASLLEIPAILVLRPKGAALTLAAVIRGMAQFRTPSRICGVIFNDCSEMYYRMYAPMIEAESGIPVLGYLPHMEEAVFESRHLGLMTAEEIRDLSARIDRIGARMEETIDLQRLAEVTAAADGAGTVDGSVSVIAAQDHADAQSVRIAVAKDAAFNFIYAQTIAALEDAGAAVTYFSPLADQALPEGIRGLYLPGGYPELYGKQLAENETMRASIRDAVAGGLPTIAECGGFLYLGESLEDAEGASWPMAGALPGHGASTGKLVRFGYGHIGSDTDSMLLRAGEQIPVHEFHYWDTTAQGSDLTLTKSSNGKQWDFGYASDAIYAGFPHLYLGGTVPVAETADSITQPVANAAIRETQAAYAGNRETLAARFVMAARRYAAKAGNAGYADDLKQAAAAGDNIDGADRTEA